MTNPKYSVRHRVSGGRCDFSTLTEAVRFYTHVNGPADHDFVVLDPEGLLTEIQDLQNKMSDLRDKLAQTKADAAWTVEFNQDEIARLKAQLEHFQ